MTVRKIRAKLVSIGVADQLHRQILAEYPWYDKISFHNFVYEGPHHKLVSADFHDRLTGTKIVFALLENEDSIGALTYIEGRILGPNMRLLAHFESIEALAVNV